LGVVTLPLASVILLEVLMLEQERLLTPLMLLVEAVILMDPATNRVVAVMMEAEKLVMAAIVLT
jgi:hypothetical protein